MPHARTSPVIGLGYGGAGLVADVRAVLDRAARPADIELWRL